MGNLYLWLKVLHLTFVVTWFAALFYLPRLFVYHAESTDATSLSRFEVMERRLYFGILLPSSILTLVLGILLSSLAWEGYVTKVWYWVKVTLVLVLFGYQGLCSRFRRQFAKKQNSRPPTFYRWFNEVPTVVLLVILILVVIKPI
ncbi:MAG: CopD family protein [Gammaproteobacteria bacterium]|nr:CopD family protein [Gammaproteobacteria bacterium]MYF01666.1 CopD family protein [Gammaproteobacteria bacterium]MYI78104.1 CopD family protein [Gammaproteobacteria bacterium]